MLFSRFVTTSIADKCEVIPPSVPLEASKCWDVACRKVEVLAAMTNGFVITSSSDTGHAT